MLAFGMPGMTEWIVILVIVLIFFGAGKLPDVFSQAGKGLKAFKDASEGKDGPEGKAASEDGATPNPSRKQLARDADDLDDEPEDRTARKVRKQADEA
jgi:sec-independent protein translocase protein TatA